MYIYIYIYYIITKLVNKIYRETVLYFIFFSHNSIVYGLVNERVGGRTSRDLVWWKDIPKMDNGCIGD